MSPFQLRQHWSEYIYSIAWDGVGEVALVLQTLWYLHHLFCMGFNNSLRGPRPLTSLGSFGLSLLHVQLLVLRFAPQVRHRPLQLGLQTASNVISRWMMSRMCLDISISLSVAGKCSRSSQSISWSSSSSSMVPASEAPLAMSSSKIVPRSTTSGSSTGSSVNNREKFANMPSGAGSAHLSKEESQAWYLMLVSGYHWGCIWFSVSVACVYFEV